MSNSVLKANEIESNKITFSTPKTNRFGGKLVYLNYERGPLRVQTPKMSLPFGVSKWESAPGSNSFKYLMEFSFNDMVNDPKMKKFYESIREVEDKVKSHAELQSVSWFKKKQSREIIDEFFKSQLKHSLDGEGNITETYPPRLRSKLIHNDQDGFRVDVYDSVKNGDGEYERLSLDKDNLEDVVPRGSKTVAILECTGIWFVEKSFGVSWKVVQVKVYKSATKLSGCCLDDEDDEVEEEEVFEEETDKVVEVKRKSMKKKVEEE